MCKIVIFLIFTFSVYANEINLGTLGAKGKLKRFGSSFQLEESDAYDYLGIIAERRNQQFIFEIDNAILIENKVEAAESHILEAIYEE